MNNTCLTLIKQDKKPSPDITVMKWWSNPLRAKSLQILIDYAWGLRIQACLALLVYHKKRVNSVQPHMFKGILHIDESNNDWTTESCCVQLTR